MRNVMGRAPHQCIGLLSYRAMNLRTFFDGAPMRQWPCRIDGRSGEECIRAHLRLPKADYKMLLTFV